MARKKDVIGRKNEVVSFRLTEKIHQGLQRIVWYERCSIGDYVTRKVIEDLRKYGADGTVINYIRRAEGGTPMSTQEQFPGLEQFKEIKKGVNPDDPSIDEILNK